MADVMTMAVLPDRSRSGADLAVPIWRSGFLVDLARSGACRSGGFRPIWHGQNSTMNVVLIRSGFFCDLAIWDSNRSGGGEILHSAMSSKFALFRTFWRDKSPLVPVRIAITSVFDETLRYNHNFSHRFRFSHLEPPNPTFPKPIFFNKNLPQNGVLQ